MQQDNTQELYSETDQEDIKVLIFKYLKYWPWFVITVFLALVSAYLYNRYAQEVYQTHTEIKILEAKDSGLDLSGLQGASPLFDLSKVNLENEIQILKSRRLQNRIVKDLALSTRYFRKGDIKTIELWGKEVPFQVIWQKIDTLRSLPVKSFQIQYNGKNKFEVKDIENETSKNVTFNQEVHFENFEFIILRNTNYRNQEVETEIEPKDYIVDYSFPDAVIDRLSKTMTIATIGDKSEVLSVNLQGENKAKNEAILNSLTSQFNQDGIQDKQLISKRTEEFVLERLKFLVKELDTVEKGLVDYKQGHNLVTIESDAAQLYTKEATAEGKRFEFETQKTITEDFRNELTKGDPYRLLPANLGIEDQNVNALTDAYNESVLKRQKLLISSTQENPMVLSIEGQLGHLKQNILESVDAYIKSIEIALNNFKNRESISSGGLNTLPEKEKELRAITRQQEIKEKLYLFLLQKREEAALQYATTSPTIKVVDYAYTQPTPVAPKKQIIYLAALLLGCLIPFGVLYMKFLLDTKINGKTELKRVLKNIPVIAEVPQVDKYNTTILKANDRSVIAEAFRILRTNLNYFKPADLKKDDGQIIYVTSSTKGEGKTFTSINLASSLASTDKKVLLIGCDLRNPQLHNYIEKGKNTIGVASFLYDTAITFNELIIPGVVGIKNLDMILSGHLPPNPAELLMNGRYGKLIEQAKANYDYVIVDTAPTVLVTDTLLISQWADVTVYVVKAHVTERKLLQHINEVYQDKKLKNIGIVLNGVDEKGGYGYNYGYGYGYGEDMAKSKWQFWKK